MPKVYTISSFDQLQDVVKSQAAEARVLQMGSRPIQCKYIIADYHGCGAWRVAYPSLLLGFLRDDIKTIYDHTFNPQDMNNVNAWDMLIMQRQVNPQFGQMFEQFMKFRDENKFPVTIVAELDDYIFDIPKYNMAHDLYQNKLGEDMLAKYLQRHDALITSTDYLKGLYDKYMGSDRVYVIKNMIPRMMWDFADFDRKTKVRPIVGKPKILFAGGANRFSVTGKDLDLVDDITPLESLIRKTCDEWEWIFMGAQPLRLADLFHTGKVKHVQWAQNFAYPKALKAIDADIAISPLNDNPFNHSKSDIKILEYGAVGIPAIYTDITPYDALPAFMKAPIGDTEGWEERIRAYIASDTLRGEAQAEQMKILDGRWLESNLSLYVDTYKKIMADAQKRRGIVE